jgi:hypothetical protein
LIGVIAGIVFLGIEIRQNTLSASVNSYQELTGRIIDFVQASADRPEITTDGTRESFEALSETEQRQLRSQIVTWFRYGDLAFYQKEVGVLPEERFESLFSPIANEICRWERLQVWSTMRPNFVPSFREYVDALVSKC